MNMPVILRTGQQDPRNQFDLEISNSVFHCRVIWAKVVSSEKESLFARYTKHSFFEIQYALQEKIEMLLDNGLPASVEQSCFAVVPPNSYHQIEETAAGARFVVAFSLELMDDALRHAFRQLRTVSIYPAPADMQAVLEMLLARLNRDQPVCRAEIGALTEVFLLEVLRTVIGDTPRTDRRMRLSENQSKVAHIRNYIHERGGVDMQVGQIAREFSISERHLCRIFTAVTGHSLRHEIDLAKLKRIEDLIISTELSFGEIAELCGFCDGYAMNKFFKRHNKVNLSDFRRLAKP